MLAISHVTFGLEYQNAVLHIRLPLGIELTEYNTKLNLVLLTSSKYTMNVLYIAGATTYIIPHSSHRPPDEYNLKLNA